MPQGVVLRELQVADNLALGGVVRLEARSAQVAPALEVGAALLRLAGDASLEDGVLGCEEQVERLEDSPGPAPVTPCKKWSVFRPGFLRYTTVR